MINSLRIERSHDFDHIFSDLYTNVGGSQLGLKNLKKCIEILSEYYKEDENYSFQFNKIRLLENDFVQELDFLIKQGIKVDKNECYISFPKKYILENIPDSDIFKLKNYFCRLQACHSNNPLYINNTGLINRFKKEYNIE